jgi:hypothetical protein
MTLPLSQPADHSVLRSEERLRTEGVTEGLAEGLAEGAPGSASASCSGRPWPWLQRPALQTAADRAEGRGVSPVLRAARVPKRHRLCSHPAKLPLPPAAGPAAI